MNLKTLFTLLMLALFGACGENKDKEKEATTDSSPKELRIINQSETPLIIYRPYSMSDDSGEKIAELLVKDTIEIVVIPGVYLIDDGKLSLVFCYDKGEVTVIYNDGIIEVTGSECHDDYLDYEAFRLSSLEKNVKGIRREIASLTNDPNDNSAKIDSLSALEMIAYKTYQDEITEYAINMNKNSAFYYSSKRWIGDEHILGLRAALSEFEELYPESDMYIEMDLKLERLSNVAIGSQVEEIEGQGVNGETLKLCDIKSNYLLIDLWASWCRPCRLEATHLNTLKDRYSAEQFEIFGISIDKDAEAWRNAVSHDKRDFPQILDGKNYDGELAKRFTVSSVPTNFLLDKDRKIIARNVYGNELDTLLDSLLSNK